MNETRALVAVLFCASLLAACAIPILPLAPGTSSVTNSIHGVVFGRIEIIRDGYDQMAYSFGKEFGWWLTDEDSGKRYVARTLTREGPFVLNLPAGRYRVTGLIYDESAAVWEGRVPASFVIIPRVSTYLGTWQIQFDFVGKGGRVSARVLEQLARDLGELRQVYIGPPKPVSVNLLQTAAEGYFSLVELRIGD